MKATGYELMKACEHLFKRDEADGLLRCIKCNELWAVVELCTSSEKIVALKDQLRKVRGILEVDLTNPPSTVKEWIVVVSKALDAIKVEQ